MRLDFPVDISLKTAAVSERGFGTILIVDNTQDLEFRYIDAEDVKDLDTETKLYKIATQVFMQSPQPQRVAIAGTIGKVLDAVKKVYEKNQDWFWLLCTDNTAESIIALSEFVAVNHKMLMTTVHDLTEAEKLYNEVFKNTYVSYHNDENIFVAEALSVVMSYKVGGKTAKFKELQGIKVAEVDKTKYEELHKNDINTYVEKLGLRETSEGKNLSSEYLDVVLGEYWIKFKMEEEYQLLAHTQDKIPYDDRGIAMLVGIAEKVLSRAVAQGIVIEGQYKVNYVKRRDVPSSEVARRRYNYIHWEATLQGAIHEGRIQGTLGYDLVNDEGVDI